MISKEERDRDRAICEAVPAGTWQSDYVRNALSAPTVMAVEHVHNRLPAYIDDAEDMDARLAMVDEWIRGHEKHARLFREREDHAAADLHDARCSALKQVVRLLRGES